MELTNVLNWRYATKRMDGKKLPQKELEIILEAIRLAPSSLGVQPFHIYVIESTEMLRKIHESACQQPQVVEGSHLIVFAARTGISDAEIDNYMQLMALTRGVSIDSLSEFKVMVSSLKAYDIDQYTQWATRQAYISLGIALVAAASLHIDATPMEGFDSKVMDQVLDLEAKGLHSVVLMALGYRDQQTDYLANMKKVRRSKQDLFSIL